MLEEVFPGASLSAWAPPAVGALSASLMFLAARLARRLASPTAPPPPAPPPSPAPSGPTQPSGRPPEGPPEKRSHERRQGARVLVLVSDAESEAKPVRGAVLDRSAAGLALSTDAPAQPGTVLSVRVVGHFQEMPWVRLVVRNCRRKRKKYVLGCQFLRPQPRSILVLFGQRPRTGGWPEGRPPLFPAGRYRCLSWGAGLGWQGTLAPRRTPGRRS